MDYIEARKAYVQECRDLYYDENWEPTSARAVEANDRHAPSCLYKTQDGRNCAAGRLVPDAPWKEGSLVQSNNKYIAIFGMKERGLYCGNNDDSISWLHSVQKMHDHPADARRIYESLMQ